MSHIMIILITTVTSMSTSECDTLIEVKPSQYVVTYSNFKAPSLVTSDPTTVFYKMSGINCIDVVPGSVDNANKLFEVIDSRLI